MIEALGRTAQHQRGPMRFAFGCHLEIRAGGELFWLRVQEDGVRTRGSWEEEVTRYRNVREDDPWWRDRTVPRGRSLSSRLRRLVVEFSERSPLLAC